MAFFLVNERFSKQLISLLLCCWKGVSSHSALKRFKPPKNLLGKVWMRDLVKLLFKRLIKREKTCFSFLEGAVKFKDLNHQIYLWQTNTSPQSNLQYICTHAGENGLHQKGSSGEGLNWAMRSPWQRGPPRCCAWGECGREFHAEVALKWRELLFTFAVLGRFSWPRSKHSK